MFFVRISFKENQSFQSGETMQAWAVTYFIMTGNGGTIVFAL